MAHKITVKKTNKEETLPEISLAELNRHLDVPVAPEKPDSKKEIIILFVLILVIVGLIAIPLLINLSDNTDGEGGIQQPQPQPSNVRYIEIEVNYTGHWSGSILVGTDYSSFDSYGYQRAGLNLTKGTVCSFSAQKMEGGYDKLELRIYSDGKQIKYAFTNSEYGIASVAWIVE
ncbi:MAG: hypothetical protein AB1665_00430 [Candidatus Thermoplasmatota archaeon]